MLDDPLCDLYSRRSAKSRPPYMTQQDKMTKSSDEPYPHVKDTYFKDVDDNGEDELDGVDTFVATYKGDDDDFFVHAANRISGPSSFDSEKVMAEDVVTSSETIDSSQRILKLQKEVREMKGLMQDMRKLLEKEVEIESQYLDFAAFVIGGIMLIFIMEQFLQIGINLNVKQRLMAAPLPP